MSYRDVSGGYGGQSTNLGGVVGQAGGGQAAGRRRTVEQAVGDARAGVTFDATVDRLIVQNAGAEWRGRVHARPRKSRSCCYILRSTWYSLCNGDYLSTPRIPREWGAPALVAYLAAEARPGQGPKFLGEMHRRGRPMPAKMQRKNVLNFVDISKYELN